MSDESDQPDTSGEIDSPTNRTTQQISQSDQAREYLESYLEGHSEVLSDLQAIVASANQLTDRQWHVVVTADGVELVVESNSD